MDPAAILLEIFGKRCPTLDGPGSWHTCVGVYASGRKFELHIDPGRDVTPVHILKSPATRAHSTSSRFASFTSLASAFHPFSELEKYVFRCYCHVSNSSCVSCTRCLRLTYKYFTATGPYSLVSSSISSCMASWLHRPMYILCYQKSEQTGPLVRPLNTHRSKYGYY